MFGQNDVTLTQGVTILSRFVGSETRYIGETCVEFVRTIWTHSLVDVDGGCTELGGIHKLRCQTRGRGELAKYQRYFIS